MSDAPIRSRCHVCHQPTLVGDFLVFRTSSEDHTVGNPTHLRCALKTEFATLKKLKEDVDGLESSVVELQDEISQLKWDHEDK